MKIADYPPQEPLSPLGANYQARVLALDTGLDGLEARYGDDPYQSLAIFRPEHASGEVLVFFHGGGWTNGYKEWMVFMAPAFLAQGITFVSAGYRLAPQHRFPTALGDCADALAWVHQHIDEHGGDPARLFVGGHSAGGHYAALLLAVTAGWRAERGACRRACCAAACRSRASTVSGPTAAWRCARASSAPKTAAAPKPPPARWCNCKPTPARPSCSPTAAATSPT